MEDCFKNKKYKNALVEMISTMDWDWFITVGMGACPSDDEFLSILRRIEAILSKKYLVNRYHKLPDDVRFFMAVAFEGERECGTRHAHILVRVPLPIKKRISHSMLTSIFVSDFTFLWHSPTADEMLEIWPSKSLVFERANAASATYAVKDVQPIDLPWSRFEFVTPPKWKKFKNENLSVLQNRDRQKRRSLGLANHAV